MSQIATDSVEDTIRKTGKTHPAPRKHEADPCPQCQHCTTNSKGGRQYDTTCWECCHFYATKFERRTA